MAQSKVRCRAVKISKSERKTIGTSFAYTGVNITIPANCVYAITAQQDYNNSSPRAIGIGSNTSNQYSMAAYFEGTSGNCIASTSGVTGSESRTFYLWAKAASSAGNDISCSGFYIPIGGG